MTRPIRRHAGCAQHCVSLSTLVLAGTLLAAGCAEARRPIFDAPAQTLAWPPAPAPARIRYVGQLSSAADLKPARGALRALGDLFAGPPAPQPFYGPRAVVVTPDGGRIWLADPGGRCVHVLDLRERTYRKITQAGGEPLLSPVNLCLRGDDRVLLADSERVGIHEFNAVRAEFVRTLRLPEEISRPAALAWAPQTRELFVVDVSHHNIKVLDEQDRLVRIIGGRGAGPGEFNFPCDVALDGDTLWIADTGNQRVQQVRIEGTPLAAFGSAGDAPGDLAMPKSVALDSDGHVYVVDARFENVQIFDRQGRLLLVFGDEGTGAGEFWLPAGLFVDTSNRIWICDSYNARVQVFDYLPDAQIPPVPTFGKVEALP